ncbi:MAG TPA: PPC domain-containing protein [Gemmatimonadales bacterium]|nr:PPC domain-containing protein [Gemmatimonadales bacterium]
MSLRRGAAVGRTLAVGLALTAALALPLRAQQQIPIGTSITGQLTQYDPVMSDQTHYKIFTFQGTAGQTVTIDLMSADFDSYLYLKDQNGNAIAHDDDSGGGRNARIIQVLPYTGMYQIVANTVGRGEVGAFTLQLRGGGEAPQMVQQPVTGGGAQQIPIGTTVQGELTAGDPTLSDGSHYKMFTFMGTAGETVQIDLMSTAFDAYLYLRNSSGQNVATDDDSGGNLNARIIRTLPYTGMYQILANTLRAGMYGPFTLEIQNAQTGGPVVTSLQPGQVTNMPSVNAIGMVGQIGLNQQVQNTLVAGGASWNNKPIHVYGYQCQPGQSAQIDILSSWDNYLIVFDPNGVEVAHDDDSGEGLNARLRFSCPTAGQYRLGVTTGLASTTPGAYTLQVQQIAGMGQVVPLPGAVTQPTPVTPPVTPTVTAPTNMIPAPGQIGQIMVGQTVQGRLEAGDQMMGSDSTYADIWQFQANAGQAIAIQLSSEDFPTYLQLLDGAGNVLQESAGHPNSGLAFTLPSAGTYQIVVNSNGRQRRTGLYVLTLR